MSFTIKDDKDPNSEKKEPKGISASRLMKLIEIDEFLTRRGRDNDPATIEEICKALGMKKEQERGIRKNLEELSEISEHSKTTFKITRSSDKPVRYVIEPGHSLFRRGLNDAEKRLISDIFRIMGNFNLPSFSQVEDLLKDSESGQIVSVLKCVDFGIQPPANKTIFSQLFDAIADRKIIEFSYKPVRYLSDKSAVERTISFCPWQLKLFGDRWGVIGMANSDGYIVKFYLDQIMEIKILRERFDEREMSRMNHLFDSVVGMSTPDHLCRKNPDPASVEYPQDVYVWVDQERVQYLRTFPIHPNMDEIDDSSQDAIKLRAKYPSLPDGGAIFWMNVYITHPLKQQLVSYLDRMIVLEPESLRLDLEDRISKMHTLYQGLSTGNDQKDDNG